MKINKRLDVIADDNGGVLTKYQNGLGIDDKLKVSLNGTARYFIADHLGSTVGLTDSSGNLTSSAGYDSFGNSISNDLTTRYQYTGREFDSFTGLYFYRARWYDANLGRFISDDPMGFEGGDMNLYGYVGNNPIGAIDPFGTYAVIFYNVRLGHLRAWDVGPNEQYADAIRRQPDWEYFNAVSGGGNMYENNECKNNSSCELRKDEGPIPRGAYAIDATVYERGDGWRKESFRLYRQTNGGFLQKSGPYSHIDSPVGTSGVERGGYYIHPGTISKGCVTIPSSDLARYNELRSLLENTSKIVFWARSNRFVNAPVDGSGFLYVY